MDDLAVLVFNAADDLEAWSKKRAEVVTIYNGESSSHTEKVIETGEGLDSPECCYVFAVDGVKGGIVVERLLGQETIAAITFCGLEPLHRGENLTRRLIAVAYQYLSAEDSCLCVVQLNRDDDRGFWSHLGFTELVNDESGFYLHPALFRAMLG